MNFIYTNQHIDRQISQIRKQIYLLMNGELSSAMEKRGLIYPKNYGLTINNIKDIAKQYKKNHDLAQRLWLLDIRETMILASLLQPTNSFLPNIAEQWIERMHNIELTEQLSINLFRHLNYAQKLSLTKIQSDNTQDKILGFTLASWLFKDFSEKNIQLIINEVLRTDYQTNNYILHKKIAICLARLSRKNKARAHYIYKSIANFEEEKNLQKMHIFQTVRQELLFLNFLNEDV